MNKTNECKVILSLFQLGARTIDKECIKKQCRLGKSIRLSEEQVLTVNLVIDSFLEWDIQNDHIEILEENYPVDAFSIKVIQEREGRYCTYRKTEMD